MKKLNIFSSYDDNGLPVITLYPSEDFVPCVNEYGVVGIYDIENARFIPTTCSQGHTEVRYQEEGIA